VAAKTAVSAKAAAVPATETAATMATGRSVSTASMLREDKLRRKLDGECQNDDRREGTEATHEEIIGLFWVGGVEFRKAL
jgi:hypothetical protein